MMLESAKTVLKLVIGYSVKVSCDERLMILKVDSVKQLSNLERLC